MKKINIIFAINTILCLTSPLAWAITKKIRPQVSEATVLGQQLVKELSESVKTANEKYKSTTVALEKEEAARAARDAAQNLIDALNDVKTFGTDVIKGYNSKQVQIAAITLAELLTRFHTLKLEIKSKRMEIANMTDAGIFMDAPIAGKEEERSKAIKDLQYYHQTKKDMQKAIADQEVVLGKTWSNIITTAIYNLIIGNSRGICYEIDWSFGAHTPQILTNDQPHIQQAARVRQKLTKRQHAAIKSWNRLSKSELLTKDISSKRQLDEAKNLLDQLNGIKQDLQNVPVKYKDVLYKVNAATESLENKMAAAKKNWLKIV